MNFKPGEKLKSLRKKRGLTQEQLAEYLGVSFQAISKWETGAAYPDIQMYPLLANFYGVTTDELLGVDFEKNEEKIREYYAQMEELRYSWKLTEQVELCRRAVAEFPGREDLRYQLASSLCEAREGTGGKRRLQEAVEICNMLLSTSTDTAIRLRTITLLAYLWHWLGDDRKAEKIAEEMPPFVDSKEFIIEKLQLKSGKEEEFFQKQCLRKYFYALKETVEHMAQMKDGGENSFLNAREQEEVFEGLLTAQRMLFGKNLLSEHFDASVYCRCLAALFLKEGDREKAYEYLQKAYEHAMSFESYEESGHFSSSLQRGMPALPRAHWSYGAAEELYNQLTYSGENNPFSAISGEEKFKKLVGLCAQSMNSAAGGRR